MLSDTVLNQFTAALGVEHSINKAIHDQMESFHRKVLVAYRRELQNERARMLRNVPMDYQAVRALDHELEDIFCRIQQLSAEESAVS